MVDLKAEEFKEQRDFFQNYLTRDGEAAERLLDVIGKPGTSYRFTVNLRDLEQQKAGMQQDVIENPAKYLPCFEFGLQSWCRSFWDWFFPR